MPYITNKKRDKFVKKVNQSYGLRKTMISITVASLIVLMVFSVLSYYFYATATQDFWKNDIQDSWTWKETAQKLINKQCNALFSIFKVTFSEDSAAAQDIMTFTLSGFGIGVCVWAGATITLGIVSLILILLMVSPKQTRKDMSTLQGAALSGKKLGKNATQTYRERATNTKSLKQGKVQK